MRRYLDVFGRERVHVIVYDDFRDDTLAVYMGVCEFLGVDPEFEPQIEVVDSNKEVRSRILRTAVKRPPRMGSPNDPSPDQRRAETPHGGCADAAGTPGSVAAIRFPTR